MKTNIRTFMITSRSFLLRIKNVSHNIIETIKTHIYVQYSFFENRGIYEIMWKNIVEPGRPQMTIWRMRIRCCMSKSTNTHSEYVILNAFHCNNDCTNTPPCCVVVQCLSCSFHNVVLYSTS
jgi:hypothetical protein